MRHSKNFCYLFSIIIGYMLGEFINFTGPTLNSVKICEYSNDDGLRISNNVNGERHSTFVLPSSNVYLGMMSAGKFISNRVQRSLDTWLQKGSWKIEVFADADPSRLSVPRGLNFGIVTLPSVDDTAYPPQKKCFMMIRHMCDKHIEQFDWFMRVDDDVYIDHQRLSRLLNTMNSSSPIFLGTPGFGMDPDDGIEKGMFYLMGGPGMIFSRGLLRLLRQHLGYCVRHMFSPHEDVEVGRCVWKHVKNAIIPIAWETIDLFYQQYDKVSGDVVNVVMEDLKPERIVKTVSYHAVKSETLLYQLHKLVLQRKIESILDQTAKIQHEIDFMSAMLKINKATDLSPKQYISFLPLLLGSDESLTNIAKEMKPMQPSWPDQSPWLPASPFIPRFASQIIWTNIDKYYRHQPDTAVPMRGHSDRERAALVAQLSEIQNLIRVSCPNFPKDNQFINGYMKVIQQYGVMLSASYQTYDKGGVKHCTVYAQISYGNAFVNERDIPLTSNHKLTSLAGGECGVETLNKRDSLVDPRLVFIVPLQGRYRALERFIERFEKYFFIPLSRGTFQDQKFSNVQLVIVLLGNDDTGDELGLNHAAANLLRTYQKLYGDKLLRYHVAAGARQSFSRGAGIQLGSLVADADDIMFFMDIDMIVTPQLASQCRHNAVQHHTAWYPIPYSQYDPDRLCYNEGLARNGDDSSMFDIANPAGVAAANRIREIINQNPLILTENHGFWRDFGFGIACMYKSDFVKAGGFDLTIEGWGEEDIKLYLSLLMSGLDVFRSKQPDLIHIYHSKHCGSSLVGEQSRACRSTKASHYASQVCLAKTYFARIN